MKVEVKFLGGAGSVTGSKYLLTVDGYNILIDCGLFQGLKELRLRNWDKMPVDVAGIDAVILTHAHIDHSGYLPKLYKDGYGGKVYCTDSSADLVEILLKDSAKLQMEETDYAQKKGYSKHAEPKPLYELKDTFVVFESIEAYKYNQTFELNKKIKVTFKDAGHILGSSSVHIEVKGDKQTKKIVFSGDLGQYNHPIHYGPAAIDEADVLFVESTYGDRITESEHVEENFARIINEAMDREGCLIIPAFAVARTQLLLYYINRLQQKNMIKKHQVYVDSPMAIDVTWLYAKYADQHKLNEEECGQNSVFNFDNLHYVPDRTASTQLNTLKKNAIIISASGMCTGGRILHHLYHRIRRSEDTVLFAGYQAEGTRGRRMLDGESEIKIFGEYVPVHCNIVQLEGLSAHADQTDLLQWIATSKKSPKMTFIVHGEKDASNTLKQQIKEKLGWESTVPQYMESFELFDGI